MYARIVAYTLSLVFFFRFVASENIRNVCNLIDETRGDNLHDSEDIDADSNYVRTNTRNEIDFLFDTDVEVRINSS